VLTTRPTTIVHLAAQAGVRYSLQNPAAYLHSNLIGHQHVLQACRAAQQAGQPVAHLLYASSSSVYGNQTKTPFSEADALEPPASLYAATKQANEQCTHAWSRQFGQPATGMRFFTVYGPWGRPDMTPMLFGAKIMQGEPIPLFNGGDLWRDFTFIDDIVTAITRLMPLPPAGGPQQVPHEVYNLGNQSPVQMKEFVTLLEAALGHKAIIDNPPWPPTEVYQTFADTTKLQAATGWAPHTPLATGLAQFAAWFLPWHAAQTA
jgi:UDP-glucuronate 4-epimerase